TSYGTRSKALYANFTWSVTPRLRLVGGARRSWDAKALEGVTTTYALSCNARVAGRPSCPAVPLLQLGSSPAAAGLPTPNPGAPLPIVLNGTPTGAVISRADRIDSPRRARFDVTTWRAGIEADLANAGVVYANVQKGYRPGGLNTAVGFETYDPERLIAYTVGARWRSVGSLIELAGEGFWWDYLDQQVSSVQPDLSNPTRNVNFTRNAGRSRIRGLEVDVQLRPAGRTTLFANAQYLDARYTSFSFLQVSANVPPLTGCATSVTQTPSLYGVDCSALRPLAAPEWTFNSGARQTFQVGSLCLDISARLLEQMLSPAPGEPEDPRAWLEALQAGP
ncbi:MAG: TonB-dependent receptor, partial [Alphaproteobacteria bacterium]